MKSTIRKICRVCGQLKSGRDFAFGMDYRAERCLAREAAAKRAKPRRKAKRRPNMGARGRAAILINGARLRARQKKLPFDLDNHVADLQRRMDAGVCEMSGVALSFTGKRSATSPSLDRIEPSLGYVYDNVRIVCWAMNAALGTWGETALRRIMEGWVGSDSGTIVPIGAENVDY